MIRMPRSDRLGWSSIPDCECLIFCQHLEVLRQFGPLDVHPCGLVGKHMLIPQLLQGGALMVAHHRVADFHSLILPLIFGTAKPLIGQGWECASKFSIEANSA